MSAELSGKRVLIVEDQYLIASELARLLRGEGGDVVGPAANRDKAMAMLDATNVDIAILDINLAGEAVYPVAAELRGRGIPFLFVTGYARTAIRSDFADAPYVDKPFTHGKVLQALHVLLAQGTPSSTRH